MSGLLLSISLKSVTAFSPFVPYPVIYLVRVIDFSDTNYHQYYLSKVNRKTDFFLSFLLFVIDPSTSLNMKSCVMGRENPNLHAVLVPLLVFNVRKQ